MSGLGHFLEGRGIATTAISLIREHAEQIAPPRALNVPFDFGHPFGAPNAPTLQGNVLRSALALFERKHGPVLEDWDGDPGDASVHPDGSADPWSCPIPLQSEPSGEPSGSDRLRADAEAELARLLPWYEHAVAERGRTTVGACGLPVDALIPFICEFLEGAPPESPQEDLPTAIALKTACEDLKQVYLEAATAQPVAPGEAQPGHVEVNDWFWRETRTAALLRAVGARAADLDLPMMDMVSTFLLLPFTRSNRAI